MPAYRYKVKTGTLWRVQVNFTEDGTHKQHCKRGFKTKREAQEYERTFLLNPSAPQKPHRGFQSDTQGKIEQDITGTADGHTGASRGAPSERTFKDICEEYLQHAQERELRADTMETKVNMINIHLKPYFDEYRLQDINKDTIRQWQAEMRAKRNRQGKPFSETFLHSVQSQLNAILNYCIKKQYITVSPMIDLRNMGRKHADEMHVWTPQQYAAFAKIAKEREATFLLFELYFWLGLRRGEALALTPSDIIHDSKTGKSYIHICKSVNAKGRSQDTKTPSSHRTLLLPQIIEDELNGFLIRSHIPPQERIFTVSTNQLYRDMIHACEVAQVPKIRLHDLRHSFASILISNSNGGKRYSPTDVARLMGHSSATITLRTYAHLLEDTREDIADLLNGLRGQF